MLCKASLSVQKTYVKTYTLLLLLLFSVLSCLIGPWFVFLEKVYIKILRGVLNLDFSLFLQ